VAAALGFAQELASRDQAVLLLDGDDDEAELTEWAGRNNIDGWIDLVRYGSSVLTCGIPMPFEGRRSYMLGVGSFTPAEVTGHEVKDLVARLRRQADDILVVAPANAVGRLWAAEADVRLFCWDRPRRSATLVANILDNFSSTRIPITGLIGFGLAQSDEVEAGEVVGEVPVEDTTEDVAAILDKLEEQDEKFVHEEEEFARRKGNSSVFWIAAAVSVVLIGAASVYWQKFLRVPSGGHFPASAQQEMALGGAAFFDSGAATFVDGSVVDASEEMFEESPVNEALAQDLSADVVASLPDSEVVDMPVIEETIPARDEIQEVTIPVMEDGFAMDPYLIPVGSGGWALHVYSFPDSLRAARESEILASKGFQCVTRAVQFKEKGRWFRLYLGSFETKTAAREARKKLMVELNEDWANPVRF